MELKHKIKLNIKYTINIDEIILPLNDANSVLM